MTVALELDVQLPDLKGSPAQVEWAARERSSLITLALERLVQQVGAVHLAAHPEERALALRVLGDVVTSHRDARYWIDHRGDVLPLLKELRPGLTAGLAAIKAQRATP